MISRAYGKAALRVTGLLALLVSGGTLVAILGTTATPAFANAANPSSANVSGSAVINSDGTVTITVQGTWTWPNPSGNGSTDFPCGANSNAPGGGHFAVGWGMIWNDSADPGYTVKQGSISEGVGSTTAVNGNPVDETVHTYTIQLVGTTGTNSTSVTGIASGYISQLSPGMQVVGKAIPAGTTIQSIGANSITLSQATKGGGGTNVPLAVFSSFAPIGETAYDNGPAVVSSDTVVSTSTSGTNNTGTFDTCGTWDASTSTATGDWGPEVHTYANPQAVPATICVNMYDVHDTIANKAGDYLVDNNDDNSINTNDFNPANGGNTCFSPGQIKVTPTVTTAPSPSSPTQGQSVVDTALVQGIGKLTPTGNVQFYVCGPYTAATACTSAGTSEGDPSTPTSTTSDSATYTSNSFTPPSPGYWCFLGVYSGDTNYLGGSDSSTTRECVDVPKVASSTSTTVFDASSNAAWSGKELAGATAYDTATVTGIAGLTPTGTVTYSLFDSSTCTAPAAGSQTVTLSAGTVPNSATTSALAGGAYGYQAVYSGDTNYVGSTGTCEPFKVLTASIALVKSASVTSYSAPGVKITYFYKVTNTGTSTLDPVVVTDPMKGLSAISCPKSSLKPNGTETCSATYKTTQANVNAGQLDNVGTATGTPPSGPNVVATAPLSIPAIQSPAIAIVKTANVPNYSLPGQQIIYSYKVTNTGNVTLNPVVVTDPMKGLSAISCPKTSLAPGASETCTASYTTKNSDLNRGFIQNTGTATGTSPSGVKVKATSTVNIPYMPTS